MTTNWTVEKMVYRPRGTKRGRATAERYVGRRISADGGKSWIEEGEVHGTFEDSFSYVTRAVNFKEYQSRLANPCKVTMLMPLGVLFPSPALGSSGPD